MWPAQGKAGGSAAMAAAASCAPPDMDGSGPKVRLECLGILQGAWLPVQDGRVAVFRGVRFAAPPTGGRRFRPPVPLDACPACGVGEPERAEGIWG